jgi:hypothetical protein
MSQSRMPRVLSSATTRHCWKRPHRSASGPVAARPTVAVGGRPVQERLDALLSRIPSDLELRPVWQATVPALEAPSEVINTPAHRAER